MCCFPKNYPIWDVTTTNRFLLNVFKNYGKNFDFLEKLKKVDRSFKKIDLIQFFESNFFLYSSCPSPENSISVPNCICSNISFCDSHIEEMPKTGIVFKIPRIWTHFSPGRQGSILSSRS